MIALMPGTRLYLASRQVRMRFGFDGLDGLVSHVSGHLFLFRSKRADFLKCLYWDGARMYLFAERLEQGRFIWPPIADGGMVLTPAQLALLIEAIDWRRMVGRALPRQPVRFDRLLVTSATLAPR